MTTAFFLFFLPLLCCCRSPPSSTYRAVVAPTLFHRNSTTSLDLDANVGYMLKQIELASTVHSAQIIVFGEQQVNFPDTVSNDCSWKLVLQTQAEYIPTIPDDDSIVPCLEQSWVDRTIARRFSCAARQYGIYVAYNVYTSYPCNTADFGPICPSGGFFVFNTLVVLDTQGALVAKYYKRSVQTEAPGAVQPTPDILRLIPDNPTFTTSFGVTFGNLICYDMVRGYPLSEYLQSGIRNIIWSNAFDGLPGVFTHVGLAQGVARAMGLNVLCASSAGEGISGGNAIVSGPTTLAVNYSPSTCIGDYYDQVPSESCFDLVVADVPVVPLEVSSSSSSFYGGGKHSSKSRNDHSGTAPPTTATTHDAPPVSPEPYRCDASPYLPDDIPTSVEPLLGLEANCVTDVVSPGHRYSFFSSFGQITCLVNFTTSSSTTPATTYTLRATETTLWTPNSPCSFRLASCIISAQVAECTDYPNCPAECYDSPLRFSEFRMVAHVPSEYTTVPLVMETGGAMSTDKYAFTVTMGGRSDGESMGGAMMMRSGTSSRRNKQSSLKSSSSSSRHCIPDYEMTSQDDDVTVVFASLLGFYSHPDWPFDCIECYDPLKGPGFAESASQFSLQSIRTDFRSFMCQQCTQNDGWKNETHWPPAWA